MSTWKLLQILFRPTLIIILTFSLYHRYRLSDNTTSNAVGHLGCFRTWCDEVAKQHHPESEHLVSIFNRRKRTIITFFHHVIQWDFNIRSMHGRQPTGIQRIPRKLWANPLQVSGRFTDALHTNNEEPIRVSSTCTRQPSQGPSTGASSGKMWQWCLQICKLLKLLLYCFACSP